MQEPSIFTRMINGEIPHQTIYEDDQCIVILTQQPINPGHMLVIPREQLGNLWDIDDPLYHHLLSVAKQMANKLLTAYDYVRAGMAVDGFGVPDHAHIHVFGLNEGMNETVIRHSATKYVASPEELKIEADKLRA